MYTFESAMSPTREASRKTASIESKCLMMLLTTQREQDLVTSIRMCEVALWAATMEFSKPTNRHVEGPQGEKAAQVVPEGVRFDLCQTGTPGAEDDDLENAQVTGSTNGDTPHQPVQGDH